MAIIYSHMMYFFIYLGLFASAFVNNFPLKKPKGFFMTANQHLYSGASKT